MLRRVYVEKRFWKICSGVGQYSYIIQLINTINRISIKREEFCVKLILSFSDTFLDLPKYNILNRNYLKKWNNVRKIIYAIYKIMMQAHHRKIKTTKKKISFKSGVDSKNYESSPNLKLGELNTAAYYRFGSRPAW